MTLLAGVEARARKMASMQVRFTQGLEKEKKTHYRVTHTHALTKRLR